MRTVSDKEAEQMNLTYYDSDVHQGCLMWPRSRCLNLYTVPASKIRSLNRSFSWSSAFISHVPVQYSTVPHTVLAPCTVDMHVIWQNGVLRHAQL